jgi:hypothetical protein
MTLRNPTSGVWYENTTLVRKTAKALLIDFDGDEQWIPLSVIHDDSELHAKSQEGEEGLLALPESKTAWLAGEVTS